MRRLLLGWADRERDRIMGPMFRGIEPAMPTRMGPVRNRRWRLVLVIWAVYGYELHWPKVGRR